MATNIPGRRVSYSETFYTDWSARGGDCALLRAQVLVKSSSTGKILVSMETRSEEETGTNLMDTAFPSSAPRVLVMEAVEVKTAIYTAVSGASTPLRGFKGLWRIKITFSGGAPGDYYVLRLFSPVFFDNSVPA